MSFVLEVSLGMPVSCGVHSTHTDRILTELIQLLIPRDRSRDPDPLVILIRNNTYSGISLSQHLVTPDS